jgi:hypothetical protein
VLFRSKVQPHWEGTVSNVGRAVTLANTLHANVTSTIVKAHNQEQESKKGGVLTNIKDAFSPKTHSSPAKAPKTELSLLEKCKVLINKITTALFNKALFKTKAIASSCTSDGVDLPEVSAAHEESRGQETAVSSSGVKSKSSKKKQTVVASLDSSKEAIISSAFEENFFKVFGRVKKLFDHSPSSKNISAS